MLIPGPAGEVRDDLGKVHLAPVFGHAPSIMGRRRRSKRFLPAALLPRMFRMSPRRSARQLDLFEKDGRRLDMEPPPPDFVQKIRDELLATLEKARGADSLPWRDWTQATLAEMRFHSIAGWLPLEEAGPLRDAFQREFDRLYALAVASAKP